MQGKYYSFTPHICTEGRCIGQYGLCYTAITNKISGAWNNKGLCLAYSPWPSQATGCSVIPCSVVGAHENGGDPTEWDIVCHLVIHSLFSFLNLFYWSIVDLQCVNFCCTTKWFSYIYIYTFSYSFPLSFVTGYWILFPVLYSKTLLFIHSIYNSLHLLTPNSQFIPSPPPHPCPPHCIFHTHEWFVLQLEFCTS